MQTTTAKAATGTALAAGRMKSGLPRYCDDGFKCPGHPAWFPTEPRRQLRAIRCSTAFLGLGTTSAVCV